MALLTFSSSPAKDSASTVTLTPALLFGSNSVAGDAYWSDSTNVEKIIVTFESTEGAQKKVLIFDATLESPTAALAFSAKARDNFVLKRIRLMDFDGGAFALERADIIAEGFDALDVALELPPI